MKVSDLFHLRQGNSFELISMNQSEKSKVNFVSRTSTNNGITGVVDEIEGCEPFPPGHLTVALSGNGVLSTFIQTEPFYTAFHVMVLEPKSQMEFNKKIFYAMCIKANAYRYAWGRQANKTLKNIELPDVLPMWVNEIDVSPIDTEVCQKQLVLDTSKWEEFTLINYFDMFAGKYYYKGDTLSGKTPYVSASDTSNGILSYIDVAPIFPGNALTIGKVGCTAYFQPNNFCATSDVTVLVPKQKFNKYIGLFISTIINLERNKWCYGRQIRLGDCQELTIKLPAQENSAPDWDYMENYIKSLPYSDKI